MKDDELTHLTFSIKRNSEYIENPIPNLFILNNPVNPV